MKPQLFYGRCPHNTRERERSVERGHVVYSSPKCNTLNATTGFSVNPKSGKAHFQCKECAKSFVAYPTTEKK